MAAPASFTLALLGDVMIGRLVSDVLDRCRRRPAAFPWGTTLPHLLSADARIANLETTLTTHPRRWLRTPKVFHFKSDPENVAVLVAARIDAVCLANNHALDYEVEGLKETLRVLDAAGVAHAGAGRDLSAARATAVFSASTHSCDGGSGSVCVALVAATDNEEGWRAGRGPRDEDSYGTNFLALDDPAGIAWTRQAVAAARTDLGAQLVVFSYHVGANYVLRPPAELRSFARAVLDAGADVFHGHSAHVAQGVELYRRKAIVYSCGDFIDDYAVDSAWRNDWGHLFKLHFAPLASGPAEASPRGAAAAQAASLELTALELIPVLLTVAQTNVVPPTHPEHAAMARRMVALSAELGTSLTMERDGCLWARLQADATH